LTFKHHLLTAGICVRSVAGWRKLASNRIDAILCSGLGGRYDMFTSTMFAPQYLAVHCLPVSETASWQHLHSATSH